MTEIIVTCISSGLMLIGVIITNISSNKKIEQNLQTSQAVTDYKIDELTREVREHNNFARRVPLAEQDISNIKQDIKEIKEDIEDLKKRC